MTVGELSLDVDAAFFKDTMEMGLGMVLRDDHGDFIVGRSLVLPGCYAVDVSEAYGVYEALSWIKHLGVHSVVIEMDAKLVFDALKGSTSSRSVFGNVIASCKIIFNSLSDVSIS
ncbi:hypothetical protein ACS0TY_023274 [Phlomoides rotata]